MADGVKIPPAINGVEQRLDRVIDLLSKQTPGGRAESPSPDVQPQEIEIREPLKVPSRKPGAKQKAKAKKK